MMPLHWIGNRLLSLVTNVLYSSTLSDMETCYKLFDAQVLEGLTVVSNRFDFEPEITAKVLRRGLPHLRGPDLLCRARARRGKEDHLARRLQCAAGAREVPLHPGVLSTGCPARSAPSWSTTTPGRCSKAASAPSSTRGPPPVVVVENGARRECRRCPARTSRADAPGAAGAHRAARPQPGLRRAGSTGVWPHWPGSRPRPNWSSSAIRTWSCTPVRWPHCATRSRPSRPGHWSGRGSSPRPARSIRRCAHFPSFTDAAGHALLALFNPENPFTLRYNPGTPEGDVVTAAGWVSGSCFLARRERARGAGRLRRGLLHVRRGHGPVLACPRTPGGAWVSPGRRRSPTCRASARRAIPTG